MRGDYLWRRERVAMQRDLRELRRPCGEGFAPRTLSRELSWRSKEEPDPWECLATEAVWNEFSTRYSFTITLKARRSPLSFLHTELDTKKALFSVDFIALTSKIE